MPPDTLRLPTDLAAPLPYLIHYLFKGLSCDVYAELSGLLQNLLPLRRLLKLLFASPKALASFGSLPGRMYIAISMTAAIIAISVKDTAMP
jgi:hypothetical protein